LIKKGDTKMKLEYVKAYVVTDYNSPAWALLERVYGKLIEKGIEPDCICGTNTKREGGVSVGDKLTSIDTVYRRNGADEDVSVSLQVSVVDSIGYAGCFCSKRIAKLKVPKNASDKVIESRINKLLESLEG
jgi:hypothetical protein